MLYYQDFLTEARKIPLGGGSADFPLDLLPNEDQKEDWKAVVRLLESEGFSPSLVTENFPDGVYIADGLQKGKVQGWGLENEVPQKIRVQNVGWPLLSRLPESPKLEDMGIDLVSHHTMAVIIGTQEGWRDVQYIPYSSLSVTVGDTTCIQYGQSAFEGACAMRNTDGDIFGFRLDQNAKRFQKSTEFLGFPSVAPEIVENIIAEIISKNAAYVPDEGKLYIRPSVNGMNKGLGLNQPAHQIITFEVAAFGDYLPESIRIEGLKNISRPETGSSKVAPNYGSSFHIKGGVKRRGYADYLSFTHEGFVEEVSTCAVGFIDEKGEFIFPPVQDEIDDKQRNILPSITRKSIIEILKYQGKTVHLRDVHASEISSMKAMFTMGNGVGVLRVSEICLKENEKDQGEMIVFGEDMFETIRGIKKNLFDARVGNLAEFEEWAREI